MKYSKVVGLFLLSVFFLISSVDALRLVRLCEGEYGTPWYSSVVLHYPVTNIVLSAYPTQEYLTENAMGTEIWRVRETEFCGKSFWTAYERSRK